MFTTTPISVVILITSIINIYVFYIAWRRKTSAVGLYFALGTLGIAIWSLASALDYAAIPLSLKIFFSKIEALGYLSANSLIACTSIAFAGNEHWLEKKWFKALMFFIPTSSILLVWTNELHGMIWTDFLPRPNNVMVFVHGPAYAWLTIANYPLIFLMVINLWMAFYKGSDFVRRQTLWLALALFFPVITNAIYNMNVGGVEGVDWSSVTFSVSGVMLLYALYGMRFLDIIPIARDKLFNNLSDGMVVLDIQNRIIDINNTAAHIFNVPVIGQDLTQIAPLTRPMLQDNPLEEELRISIKTEELEPRYFDIRLSPLFDGKKRVIGRLLIFRDITELKENELRLLQLTQAIEQSPLSIVITDLTGAITYVNPQFSELTGYVAVEVIGQNSSIQKSGQTSVDTYRDLWNVIKAGRVWKGELLNRKKNGELYWEQSTIAPIFAYDAHIINFLEIKVDITERKQAEENLQQRLLEIENLNQELQESQAQLVEQQRALATVRERQRLARDMHDSVNQSIHSLMLFSETLVALLQKNRVEEALQAVAQIQESGHRALKEIRLMLYRAQSTLVDQNVDMVAALEDRLNMVERRAGVSVNLIGADEAGAYCPALFKEDLYWIIMEALNNSLKYSHSKSVEVCFKHNDGYLSVSVTDDGAGFDPERKRAGGFGMRSMRERAELIGGHLVITSAPGNGTRVFINIKME